MEIEKEYIYITNDDGIEETFKVDLVFKINESRYMLLAPVENEDDVVYAFRYEEGDGESLLLYSIDDEEEWKNVELAFNKLKEESGE